MRLVALDFDGAFTDLRREFPVVREQFFSLMRARTKLSQRALRQHYCEQLAVVRAAPHIHGWRNNGHVIAAGTVDPYIELRTVCELILQVTGALATEAEREKELDSYFGKLNPEIVSHFKPRAATVLTKVEQLGWPAIIVTNSHTGSVKAKLAALDNGRGLFPGLMTNVYGHAGKYVPDVLCADVPRAYLRVRGFDRPMLVRRAKHFAVLDKHRREHGLAWSDVIGVGDIFENDLAMLFQLGGRVGLVDHHRVPHYEREFMWRHAPQTRLLRRDLSDTLRFITE